MKYEKGKEYILVTISGENDKLFVNLHDANQYIHDYEENDYNGYYDAYLEYPKISVYKMKIIQQINEK